LVQRLQLEHQLQEQVHLQVRHQAQAPSSSAQVFPPSPLSLPSLASDDGSRWKVCATTSLLPRLLAQASTQ
jgi:hypothetical protein